MTYILLVIIPTVLLSLWAQSKVHGTFRRFQDVPSRGGLSGADVARMLLRARGIDVRVERTAGHLTDHYDPRDRTLRLSEATYDRRSVAAIGVAAHEAGHALQHADSYAPLRFRSAIVPVVSIGSRMLPFLMLLAIFGGFASGSPGLFAWLFVAALASIAIFSLATLPVEYNASARALQVLEGGGILAGDELAGAKKVLDAAALTYVAAAVAAVAQLAYWAMLLLGGRGGSDE